MAASASEWVKRNLLIGALIFAITMFLLPIVGKNVTELDQSSRTLVLTNLMKAIINPIHVRLERNIFIPVSNLAQTWAKNKCHFF
ncbi:MAG: hypothetical protein JNM34_08195 [Chthonomonadaceae bacterium]|jgi:hypothetical protein|nr:hypothetical protein [Chthonomonadaceae bacterium]